MTVSKAQEKVLRELVNPFSENVTRHPSDAYNQRTIGSLIEKGLVEKYHYQGFLHGAVRLTAAGKEFLK
ncbi:hypothetical protein FT641_18870 [Bacillus paranthracis]|uniref:hypothetical protein n=1 Tax=Bacillus paranthracis TaxID=2026186 RepID=UPI00187AA095|nr:hypothetical protein [Bacillus paranthracis]MBE7114372.1 hypothetical protein [Bacillus paranthracis]MBE7154755.1 hypothetical protein [Bacillus paranthracis]